MDVAQLRLTLGFNSDGNGAESAFSRGLYHHVLLRKTRRSLMKDRHYSGLKSLYRAPKHLYGIATGKNNFRGVLAHPVSTQ